MTRRPLYMLGQVVSSLFRPGDTKLYPEKKMTLPKSYRGRIDYNNIRCSGCRECEDCCPSDALRIVPAGAYGSNRFSCEMDYGSCLFCGECVRTCPMTCFRMTNDLDFVALERDELRVNL